MQLTDINTIKSIMRRHGMNFSKALGQNFLINPDICPQMVEESGVNDQVGVLEIGPGIGVLTTELADRAKKVVAIELDSRLIPILGETLAGFDNVKIIEGDVLKLNLRQILDEEFQGMDVMVCANLPYYITSPIIMRFLEEKLPVVSITAMVQKEAGERICATMPSRAMGAVTASVAYYATSEILFGVGRESFLPSPKVDSCAIHLQVLTEPLVTITKEKDYFRVIKASFVQRRKTISNSLSSGLAVDKTVSKQLLENAGISPTLRAEQLSLEMFAALANALTEYEKGTQ